MRTMSLRLGKEVLTLNKELIVRSCSDSPWFRNAWTSTGWLLKSWRRSGHDGSKSRKLPPAQTSWELSKFLRILKSESIASFPHLFLDLWMWLTRQITARRRSTSTSSCRASFLFACSRDRRCLALCSTWWMRTGMKESPNKTSSSRYWRCGLVSDSTRPTSRGASKSCTCCVATTWM